MPHEMAFAGLFRWNVPLLVVIAISIVIGLVMVLVFAWTSDQKAIRVAKDQLKAHMLAVRLFQDQLGVVLRAYGSLVAGTGRYLKLAFKPLLFVIIPLTFLIIQLDHYLGSTPVETGQPFLVKAQASSIDDIALKLPPELTATAPAVHDATGNEVTWRVVAQRDGAYDVSVAAGGQTAVKRVVVASNIAAVMPKLSSVRLRDQWLDRMLSSAEPALPADSPICAIAVTYPDRSLDFAWIEWNWIWLFFVLSLVAGFAFKSLFGIEI
jgi:hypothetical protein